MSQRNSNDGCSGCLVMLGIALLPLSQLRRYEHRLGEAPGSDGGTGPEAASAPS